MENIVSIVSGICVCAPLVVALISTITAYCKQKNWSAIVKSVLEYMQEAEDLFDKGADRKEWVMAMIEETATQLNYNYDDESKAKISKMIDDICGASKVINSKEAL